ncbi:MAG: sodium:solute symporter [Bacteroidaceae bacterium]|nr:sodium:solute symporter [Bacteroidaceae bacterium]
MALIDIIVFLLFTGGIVLFGCCFFNRKSTSADYTHAGHSLPGWVVGMSIFSTYVSSISYLGNPGSAYAGNWNAFVFSLSIPIASWVAARYFVPFYRRQTSVSAYTMLEERFGTWARLYAAVFYLLTQMARMGSILFLLALPMNLLMGWNIEMVIIITSVAIILYAMLGGIRAVIWTEAIQGFILIGGALLCLCILLFSMPEGPLQTFRIAFETVTVDGGSKFSLGSFSITDFTTSTFWVCLVYGVFTNLQNYGIDQNYVQRYHTAKSEKEAKHAALFGGYLYMPVSAVFFLIGTALFAYYQVFPEAEVNALKADYVFPFFIVHQLPVGLKGLLIASVFAAGMSTVATSVTSASTILLSDFYLRARPAASDREKLLVLKSGAMIVGVAGIIVALAMMGVDGVLDAWWKLSSVFSGGILGLFLLTFLGNRVKHAFAAVGTLCGLLVIVWISIPQFVGLPDPKLHTNLSIVVGTVAIFLVGFLLTRLFGDKPKSMNHTNK